MTARIIVVSVVMVILVACSRLSDIAAEEIDKKPIVELWRKEIAPLKQAYANCQIAGEQWWDRDFDGDGLELHSSFKYASRGRLKRLDVTNAQLLMRLNECWVIGPKEAYRVIRNEADQPYKLWHRSVEKDLKKYEEMRLLTPYTFLRSSLIAAGPVSVPIFGIEGADFIAQEKVRLRSDEHPDIHQPGWRKIEGTLELAAGGPPREFSITMDEKRHWALIEFVIDLPQMKDTTKFIYAANDGKTPKLSRIEIFSDVKGGRSGLAGEYRITELRFEAPEEKAFTLASFGIAEDAEQEIDK